MTLKRMGYALLALAVLAALWFSSLKPEVKQTLVGWLSGPAEGADQ